MNVKHFGFSVLFSFLCTLVYGQELLMQNGVFNACQPQVFTDSGGALASYAPNENFTITICPDNSGEFLVLNFTSFSTQENVDILTIYNGSSTNAPVLGTYSGLNSPGQIVANNQSGCLTISFTSNGSGETIGWLADIICSPPCQEITPIIESTIPSADPNGVILVSPGVPVQFNANGIFSVDGSNAQYDWDFGDGNLGQGPQVSHQYTLTGTYTVILKVSDNSPLNCASTEEISVVVLNPVITINNPAFAESSYGPEQLIEEVLVSGGCSEVDNFEIVASGNPDELGAKSYGYFTKGGADNFPFEEGIILSTGFASAAGNAVSNVILSTTLGTAGDSDLEQTLNAGVSGDATSFKFNFTPTGDKISFRYIMASEEYGDNFECTFSDGFAFLLRELGSSNYENIAVLPNGDDVTVTNINNNPNCASNPEFFEGYNIGQTNFNGRTKILTATADVIPNSTYEIKLVIADLGDSQYDSAIFLEAGSFNLGGELGDDITIASGNAECGGTEITLDTNAPTAVHTWFKDGVQIIGESNSTLNVTETAVYSVNVNFGPGCETTDSILVEFKPNPTIEGIPNDLVNCGDTGTAQFDLTLNTAVILGAQSADDFRVGYYTSFNDAENAVNAISNPSTFNGNDQDVIYARVEDRTSQSCFEISSFNLNVVTTISPNPYTYTLCDDNLDGSDTNGFRVFDLELIDGSILGSLDPSIYKVSYHRNGSDADLGLNAITSPYTNTISGLDTVYARVENSFNSDCYGTSEVRLVVSPLPDIVDTVDLLQCDTDTDGFSDFNLRESEPLISANYLNEDFSYHLSLSDAEQGINAIANPLSYSNTDASSNADLVYVRVSSSEGCYRISELELYVSTTQIPLGFELVYEVCDDYLVDNDNTNGIASFDFSAASSEIISLYPLGQALTVSYYESVEDALSEQNAIVDVSDYRNENSPFEQRVIVRVDSEVDNACLGLGEHIVLRTVSPQPNRDPSNLVLCDQATPGDLSEVFDLTQNESYIFNGQPNLVASYHLSLSEAESNTGSIATPWSYTNSSAEERIYVRVTNSTTGCYATVFFDIRVEPLPQTVSMTDFLACESNSDGIFSFDLESKTPEVLSGQDPSVYQVSYHLSQSDADNLSNALVSPYNNISNPQVIYVAITNTITSCRVSTQSFLLEVEEAAQVNPDNAQIVYELCDTVNANDGSTQFDLSTQSLAVLDGQDPSRFILSYHASEADAIANSNPLPLLYENLSNPQVIYARVSNSVAPEICFDVGPLTLQVNLLPQVELEDRYVLCASTNGSEAVVSPPLIDTGLSGTTYSFEWSYNGSVMANETAPSLLAMQSGVYSVVVRDITTSLVTRCESFASTEVIESDLASLTAEVSTEAFSNNHVIEALATGLGVYEYSLDQGPWQSSGSFEGVSMGTHVVSARDRNGCGVVSVEVEVMDYPVYFTPNGDGNNDLWRIPGLERQPNAKIYIFDRYGKLLQQLSPSGEGWDGTYNGNLMPSGDYWFTVNYQEPTTGEPKLFKAHFTLKR